MKYNVPYNDFRRLVLEAAADDKLVAMYPEALILFWTLFKNNKDEIIFKSYCLKAKESKTYTLQGIHNTVKSIFTSSVITEIRAIPECQGATISNTNAFKEIKSINDKVIDTIFDIIEIDVTIIGIDSTKFNFDTNKEQLGKVIERVITREKRSTLILSKHLTKNGDSKSYDFITDKDNFENALIRSAKIENIYGSEDEREELDSIRGNLKSYSKQSATKVFLKHGFTGLFMRQALRWYFNREEQKKDSTDISSDISSTTPSSQPTNAVIDDITNYKEESNYFKTNQIKDKIIDVIKTKNIPQNDQNEIFGYMKNVDHKLAEYERKHSTTISKNQIKRLNQDPKSNYSQLKKKLKDYTDKTILESLLKELFRLVC